MNRPLRRIIERFHVRYRGDFVRLDCNHDQPCHRRRWSAERVRCLECPSLDSVRGHSPADTAPLRTVRSSGIDNKDGPYEVLDCGHVLQGPAGSPERRRCRECLDAGRS